MLKPIHAIISDSLQRYIQVSCPDTLSRLYGVQALLLDENHPAQRSNMKGHATGSLVLVTPDMQSVLLIEHIASGLRLCPGGHLDEGESPLDAALREAAEETGVPLDKLKQHPRRRLTDGLIDIDSHPIAENPLKKEGSHWHHDFAYLRIVPENTVLQTVHDAGTRNAAWFPLKTWAQSPNPRKQRIFKMVEALVQISPEVNSYMTECDNVS